MCTFWHRCGRKQSYAQSDRCPSGNPGAHARRRPPCDIGRNGWYGAARNDVLTFRESQVPWMGALLSFRLAWGLPISLLVRPLWPLPVLAEPLGSALVVLSFSAWRCARGLATVTNVRIQDSQFLDNAGPGIAIVAKKVDGTRHTTSRLGSPPYGRRARSNILATVSYR
jgi:hypothetical protein